MLMPPAEPLVYSFGSTISRFSGFFYQCYLIPLALAVLVLSLGSKNKVSAFRIAFHVLIVTLLGGFIYFIIAPAFPDFKKLGTASQLILLALIIGYAVFFSPMQPHVRIVVTAAVISNINWAQSISTQILMPTLPLPFSNAIQLLLLIISLIVIVLFRPSQSERIPTAYWLSMLIIAFISTACLYSIRILGSHAVYSFGNSLAVSIVFSAFYVIHQLIYYLYYVLVKQHRLASDMATMQTKLEQDLEYYKRSEALTQEYRSLRHELKNHFSVMETLLHEKRYDQLQQYFEEYAGSTTPHLEEFICPNPLISSVISHQINTARSAGIQLDVVAAVPESLPIPDADICSLLSNLLDNSIEGCLCTGETSVRATIHSKNGFLFITVVNPAPPDILERNPELLTTKKNATGHGYGIPIIRQIAEKYDGCVTFTMDGGYFTADVMLSLEE